MYTVSRLGKKFRLSRSTLLYYDSIGLLSPSHRANNRYRQYTEEDAERLEQICLFRRVGLSLDEIKKILEAPRSSLGKRLEKRLDELNEEIRCLRRQQRLIIGILKNDRLYETLGPIDKENWKALLASSGFTEQDMHEWHGEFERSSPEKHQKFLEFLQIPAEEIKAIRAWARD